MHSSGGRARTPYLDGPPCVIVSESPCCHLFREEVRSTASPTTTAVSMLARYHIIRGRRPDNDPLPDGVRQDTRKHTRHVLRPTASLVQGLLDDPDSYPRFARGYRELLEQRFASERARFDELAELARQHHVYLGCNCPTARQPDVQHCHTVLALAFLRERYPDLSVRMP